MAVVLVWQVVIVHDITVMLKYPKYVRMCNGI